LQFAARETMEFAEPTLFLNATLPFASLLT
jgi:hypothetical protein